MASLTILIPAYNAEDTIQKCLDSIFTQNFGAIEVIVVDDGSKDNTALILDSYVDAYPDYIKVIKQKNSGLFATRKLLFENAGSDYVLCVDSDDSLEKNSIDELVNVINTAEPDVIIFDYFYLKGIYRKRIVIDKAFPDEKESGFVSIEKVERKLAENRINAIWRKCFRKKLLDLNNDYPLLPISMGEDLFQSIPLIKRAKSIFYHNKAILNYRVLSGSMSRSYNESILESYDHVVARFMDTYSDAPEGLKKVFEKTILGYIDDVFDNISRAHLSYTDSRQAYFSLKFFYVKWLDNDKYKNRFFLKLLFNESYLVLYTYSKFRSFFLTFKSVVRRYMYG